MKAQSIKKCMDVCDEKVTDEQHDDQSKGHPHERIWINRVATTFHPDTDAPLRDECELTPLSPARSH